MKNYKLVVALSDAVWMAYFLWFSDSAVQFQSNHPLNASKLSIKDVCIFTLYVFLQCKCNTSMYDVYIGLRFLGQ